MSSVIYLDNNATTRLDPRVLESMLPWLTDEYANASSPHQFAKRAEQAVKQARQQVADLIGSETNEITFTSGATEAINLALKGVADSYKHKGRHIISCITEHSAVLDTLRYLEQIGYEVTYLPVDTQGLTDPDMVRRHLRSDTMLISLMWVNNETGVIQPIGEIADMARSNDVLFMTDATQAVGKLKVDVEEFGIDLMTFSAHKFHGPKGTGALYKRRTVRLTPLIHGGGHEKGLRSGTLNVPGIVGLGKAADIAIQELNDNVQQIGTLRDDLEAGFLSLEDTFVNGIHAPRLHNVSNICFRGIDADTIISGLRHIAVSNGSACTSTVVEPSHVLKAIGLSNEDAFSSIRFSLGKFNTREDITTVLYDITALIQRIRSMTNV